MKKHYAWIVPWTSSQLFVRRLNEKSIPGLWIKQKPPFLVELVSYCHSIYLVTPKKKQKETKKNPLKGNSSMDIFITPDCKGLRCQFLIDFKMGSKQRVT